MRPSWVEIDLDAIADNVAAIARLIHPADLCAVVKADAYGHGDVPVATTALDHGATSLAVALVEEAIRLREAGVEAPILLLSEPAPDDVGALSEWSITPTGYRSSFLDRLNAGSPPVHLKVDTGMHRVGADPDEIVSLAQQLGDHLGGLWTHLAVAEEDASFTERQMAVFKAVEARLHDAGIYPPVTHIANTGGAVAYPAARRQMCRVGLGIYGLYPSPEMRDLVDLRPVMRVVSHVSYVRRHPAGTRPSYGRKRPLPGESTVATVPIGYADGVSRGLSSTGGEVLIHGRRFPMAGTVTMDQVMVDVGDHEVDVGDEVVLIGRQGDEEIGADDWANALGTISYEIVCGIGPRLPRRYIS